MQRVVFITGVNGGIGSATAKVFQAAGWNVIGQDIKATGPDWLDAFHSADVSDLDAMTIIMERISTDGGRLDAIVNNAAVQISSSVVDTTAEDWDRQMAVNVKAVYQLMKLAHSLLTKSDGAIVNVASVHALATSAGIGAYAASKGALVSLTRAAAIDLASDGIRVNAVLPGAVDTAMLSDGLNRSSDPIAARANLVSRTIMNRVGKPEEIAQAILFLADIDRSSFITGQNLIVDGGAMARLSTE